MSSIKVERHKKYMRLTLNRPEKRNAFDQQMIEELTVAFRSLAKEESARILLIEGAGKSFSAGADLSWMKSMVNFSEEENRQDSRKLYEMYRALEAIPYPVLGRVQGHVMGGAIGLVALCDLVAAEKDTKFCFSEIKMGLAPAVVSEFVAKKIQRPQLVRWFLTAEFFGAAEAKEMGLVSFVGEAHEVEHFIKATTERILANGPKAVRATKELIRRLYANDANIGDYTADLIAKLRTSDEGQEGLKAFFEKRKARWDD